MVKKQKKIKKIKLKSISLLKKQAQSIFNNWIRNRDILLGHTFICISCEKELPIEKMNCGHYFPVKRFQHLRYNEDNAHGECMACNGFNPAHLIYYTKHLIEKIGIYKYNNLYQSSLIKPEKDFTREELEEIKLKYKLK